MKKVLFTICILFFVSSVCFGIGGPLANSKSDGLYARSLKDVLRLEADDIDLATAALIISEQWSDMVHGRRYLSRLDDIAIEIRLRVVKKRLGMNYKAIPVINEYLFEELGFKSVAEATDPDDLFLHSVMDRKSGYCLSLSVLYLSIGERLGLPLYGVVVPGHFFVRYDDGKMRFNIETTSKGGMATNEHYRTKFKVPSGYSDSIYMENLDKRQTLGCFFNNLGNTYIDVNNLDSAQQALERAVQINPLLAESRLNLGNVYLRKERLEDAIYEYQEALKINPRNSKAHNNLGNAYSRRGWLDYAIGEYEAAISQESDFVDAYKNISLAYAKKKIFDEAKYYLNKAIELSPKDFSNYNQMGDLYLQIEHYEEAIGEYKKALSLNPLFMEAHYNLAISYNKLGLVEQEISAYKKTLEIKPDLVAALINLGNAYFNKKKFDLAIVEYKKAAAINFNDATINYNLGTAYSQKKDHEQSVFWYNKALTLDPEMGDAHNGLAFGLYQLGKYELALKHLETAKSLWVEISEELLAAIEDKL